MSESSAQPRSPNGAGALPPETGSYLSHEQVLVVLSGLMAGMFLAALDQSIVGTALPTIVSDLGGLDHLSWVVTAYLLTSTAATPLWGKISDLYGRRLIFQLAIAIFLIGSALCGLSQNMPELIAFRALQGIGGGGLFAIALSTIGDIIPPRERGRYQGYFGAVFGLSSVAGPLLGGWFTDGPGWRWIFYVNLPIGAAALVVTTLALKMPRVRREHSIDYAGAALIVAAVSSLLLYLNWAGDAYGWSAPLPLGLLLAFVAFSVLFVVVEARAKEPIIPLRLFKNPVFRVGNIFGFLSGMAMFGAIIFLPLYLQGVKGMSPTKSGLAMLPMIVGLFTASINSGRLITRTGRYKVFPIVGATTLIVALLLLTRLHVATSYWQVAIYLFLFGAGLGMTLQTIVVAVQNAVEMRDLGAATSSTTFFRSLGGAVGAALFGAVLGIRLDHYLHQAYRGAASSAAVLDANNIQAMQRLTEPDRHLVLGAFTHALDDVFLTCLPFIALALIVALFLEERPLRSGPTRPTVASEETATNEVVVVGH
ncbi:MAG TPA: MDR family MFS transporter [Thermomicrobiales bacterium]|nr:MDR family MFS transporter [Thermomicrobiales bacterium]